MPDDAVSFESDLEQLLALDRDGIQRIANLLENRNITKTDFDRYTPPYFQRMLIAHSIIVDLASKKEIEAARDSEIEIGSLIRWFDTNLSGLEDKSGYTTMVQLAKHQQDVDGIQISPTLSQESEIDGAILGNINGVRCTPLLSGNAFVPSIRALFYYKDKVLFNSTGDWDDWTFVAKCLLLAMSSQASDLRDVPQAWTRVPKEKITEHLKESKKFIREFEAILKDKMPEPSKPKPKKAARKRRTRK